ncbi:MAG: hypothetical protein QOH97_2873 [Actinoplanes sp.]|jgi:subtilisin family serine protease|nr:hypothetical protein [Actinoplanes sp.]
MMAVRAAMCALVTVAATAVPAGGPAMAAPVPTPGAVIRGSAARAVPKSFIVVLKPAGTVAPAALARRYGGTMRRTFGSALHGFEAIMTEAAAKQLALDPTVAYVERNQVMSVADVQDDPPWGLDRVDERHRTLDQQYTYDGDASAVHAYVIDTGIRFSHETFDGRAVSGYDAYDHDDDASDCEGHGTHVAGTIGGREYGVAKKVQLVAVRVLGCTGKGSTASVIEGVNWVTEHAIKPAVANMSLSGPPSDSLDAAVQASIASGVTYGVAAGNGDDFGDPLPACNDSPSRTPEAITVAATTKTDARASYSNYGPCVDIFAPGDEIESAGIDTDTARAELSGTSMATPHVVGAAALALAEHPTYTPQQVADALLAAATPDLVADPGDGSPNKLLYTGGPDRDFELALDTSGFTVATGQPKTVRIDLSQIGAGRQRVQLTVHGVPDQVTTELSDVEVDTWAHPSATLTLTPSVTAALGSTPVTVVATGSDVTRSQTFTLTVAAPEVTLSLSDDAGSGAMGTMVATTVRSTVVAGDFPAGLDLTVAGLPAGVISPDGYGSWLPAGASATVHFVITPDALPGTYPLTIITSSGAVTASAPYTLTVAGTPNPCGKYDTPGLEVPGGSTDSTPITVTDCGRNASALSRVYFRVNRPYPSLPGDAVAVDLIAPDGSIHALKPAGTYPNTDRYVLDCTVDLSGLPADGEWRLQVRNDAQRWIDLAQVYDWMLTV